MSGFAPWWRLARYRTLTPPTSGGDVTPPPGVGVQAKRAYDFWNGVGFSMHLTRKAPAAEVHGNAYEDLDATIDALQRTNVAHIRSDFGRSVPYINAINRVYAETGVRTMVLVGEPANTPKSTHWPTGYLDFLFANGLNIDAIAAFEGANEQNLPHMNSLPVNPPGINGYVESQWAEANREHGTEAFATVHSIARPTAWRTKPYVGISYGNVNNTGRMIAASSVADWDALCDIGNMHKYALDNPAVAIQGPITSVRTHMYNAANKELYVTETGHHTLMPSTDGHHPTPEDATAWDQVRLPFVWLRQPNITRMYYYELTDEYHPDAGKDNQAFFGQFRYKAPEAAGNWVFKPSGEAIGNLLGMFKDPAGAAYAPGKLDYTITASAPNLWVELHQRSTDDAFLLTLYRDGSIWRWTQFTPPYGTYTAFPDVNVTIDLGRVWSTVEHRSPSNVVGAGGGNPLVATLTNVSTVTIPVGKQAKVLVIK